MLRVEAIESPGGPCVFFFNDTATTEIYTLSLHDALPISIRITGAAMAAARKNLWAFAQARERSEEHTSELQSRLHLVCRLLLEKKNTQQRMTQSRLIAISPFYCTGHDARTAT